MADSKKFFRFNNITIKARLRKENYANFLEYYHKNTALEDYFYKYLCKLATQHKLLAVDESSFKSNFTNEGFYFKKADILKVKNAIGRPCLLEDILDKDVVLKLKILPYNFEADGKQLIGISITCLEASAKPDSLKFM